MGETGFKHITVNVADEEDVVIRAGAVDGALADAPASVSSDDEPDSSSASEPAAVTSKAQIDEAPETGDAADSTAPGDIVSSAAPTIAGAPAGAVAERPAGAREQRARADERSRTTTLEDLKGDKMPLAQRIVILAAVICIIGAIVYYFAFMR